MNLKELRIAKGLSQKRMADLIAKETGVKLSVPLLSSIESGKVIPSEKVTLWATVQEIELNKDELTLQEQNVLGELVRRNEDNPLTRRELKDITKITDAKSREVIGSLREKGFPILFRKNPSGYYYEKDLKKLESWANTYRSYAYTIFARCNAMVAKAKAEGQITIYEEVTNAIQSSKN